VIVVINKFGKFARVTNNWEDNKVKQTLDWVELNNATVFPDFFKEKDYKLIFREIKEGMFIHAEESRTVKLTSMPNF
jgi:hypothetical protein